MNKKAPKAKTEPPRAPAWLNKLACEYFGTLSGRLQAMGLASSSHTEALSTLAMRLAEMEIYSKVIDDEGATYTSITQTGGTIVRPRPECALRSEAARQAQSLLAEFGLTPASQGKVSVPDGAAKPQQGDWESLVND